MTTSLPPSHVLHVFLIKIFLQVPFFWAGKTRLIGCVGSEGVHHERLLKRFLTLSKTHKTAFLATGNFSDTKERINRSSVRRNEVDRVEDQNDNITQTAHTHAKLPVKKLTGEYKKNERQHTTTPFKMNHITKKSNFVLSALSTSSNDAQPEFFGKKGAFFVSSLIEKVSTLNYCTSLRRYFTVTAVHVHGGRFRTHQAHACIGMVKGCLLYSSVWSSVVSAPSCSQRKTAYLW